MGNSGAKKKLTILPSETSYLNTLGNLFPILIHWEIYSLSILIHRVLTGYSMAYVNTWGSAPTPPPPPAELPQPILLTIE